MSEPIKVNVTLDVSVDMLKNLLTSVREGGYSSSWLVQINPIGNDKEIEADFLNGLYNTPFVEGGKWEIKVCDERKKRVVDLEAIKKGTQIFFEKYPKQADRMMKENDDAETADIWFQCCALGDVVYG